MTKDYDPRIAEARRIARQMSRDRGTPYQAELEEVARSAGATSWPAFVETPSAIPISTPTTARQDVATDATEQAGGEWVSDDKKDLLRRLSIGLLGTVVCVVLGTCLLIGSAFVGERWSAPVEICGTVLCASGVLLIPSAMSGYVMGLRVQDTGHAMPVRWRIGMAAAQAWFILGVARHLIIG